MADYIIGLTGGIGSGKTAVSDRFADLGISIIDADIASRTVVEPGKPALAKIQQQFGEQILLSDGSLDRAALRQEIFAKPESKQWLEKLLHPLIGEEIFNGLINAPGPYAILVSPLLVEAGQDVLCQRICVVDVPEALQLERTMARDDNDAEQVKAIMASQASRQQRLEKASDIIENWHGFEQLDLRVAELHQAYQDLAEAHKQATQA